MVRCPASESIQEMKEACDYLMIPFDEKTIQTSNLGERSRSHTHTHTHTNVQFNFVIIILVGDFLNELSNDGAKQQFEKYVTQEILPVMVLCARVSASDDLYRFKQFCHHLHTLLLSN